MKEMSFKDMKEVLNKLIVLNKERDERLDKRIKVTDERLDKRIRETDAQIKKTGKIVEENALYMKKLGKQLWGVEWTQWEIAEDLMYRNVLWLLEERWMDVKEININVKKWKSREYDIIVKNWKEIVLVEVKNKVSVNDIKKFINKQIPAFKEDFPEYKNKKIYGWIWWLVFKSSIEKCAENKWLYIFTQNWEWWAKIANKKKFKPTAL